LAVCQCRVLFFLGLIENSENTLKPPPVFPSEKTRENSTVKFAPNILAAMQRKIFCPVNTTNWNQSSASYALCDVDPLCAPFLNFY